MNATLKNPQLRTHSEMRKSGSASIDFVPNLVVDYEALDDTPYAFLAWRVLIEQFTAQWVAKKYAPKTAGKTSRKIATIWARDLPSGRFSGMAYSCYIAPIGLPLAYLHDLLAYLEPKLGRHVHFEGYSQPHPRKGWSSLIHIQDGKAWEPLDEEAWVEVTISPQK